MRLKEAREKEERERERVTETGTKFNEIVPRTCEHSVQTSLPARVSRKSLIFERCVVETSTHTQTRNRFRRKHYLRKFSD